MLTDTQVLGLTWIHSRLHTQRYTDPPTHTHTSPDPQGHNTCVLCAYTQAGPHRHQPWHARTHAGTHSRR